MKKSIGQTIKELRIQKGITQEELAELVCVTPQAISKWEREVGYPDIAHIVPLANAFGVSIDELFNYKIDIQESEIKEYTEKSRALKNKGLVKDNLILWREASKKFPRNHTCKEQLAYALHGTLNSPSVFSKEERCSHANETIEICKSLLNESTDNAIRNRVLQLLVLTYSNDELPSANEEEAVKYANMACSFYVSREKLFEHAWFTKENEHKSVSQKHFNNLLFMDSIHHNIHCSVYENVQERIFANETMVKLWNTLIYDGNFLFYSCRLARLHRELASDYAELKNKDKVMENLLLAKKYALQEFNQPLGVQYYTSIFVNKAFSDKSTSTKNYTETSIDIYKNEIKDKCYDFIREDADFKELLNI